jgi:hypothetical protein
LKTDRQGESAATDAKTAERFNILGSFLGKHDVPELTADNLQGKYGFRAADVMVLFGGSILAGGDVLAQAMQNNIAKKYGIVGGAGHTTETLRQKMKEAVPGMNTDGMTEAELFSGYLQYKYHLQPDFLECRSTNCGNNCTYLLGLLKEKGISFNSIILTQDAAMQRRMDAVLRKYEPDKIIINYAAYAAELIIKDDMLEFKKNTAGMWEPERYITLLMGEIPRLSDTKGGYGPQGKNYLAHVDIPEEVYQAFAELKKHYGASIRNANPLYTP